ncbi:hypothetical protein LINPERHAP2_LOCUS13860 [Linum perenne]
MLSTLIALILGLPLTPRAPCAAPIYSSSVLMIIQLLSRLMEMKMKLMLLILLMITQKPFGSLYNKEQR